MKVLSRIEDFAWVERIPGQGVQIQRSPRALGCKRARPWPQLHPVVDYFASRAKVRCWAEAQGMCVVLELHPGPVL
jgi:hypothetical protein